jgi:hypothetical protein
MNVFGVPKYTVNNGRIATLNRFISKSAERSLPFFKALKGKGKIERGLEKNKSFAELKSYIKQLAILSLPVLSGTAIRVP